MIVAWLIALILFVIVEAATYALVSIWFAAGVLVALVSAAVNAPVWLQVVLFLVISAVTLAATRSMARKFQGQKKERTNADKVLEMTGVVTERIDNIDGTGTVYVDGKVWSARSENGDVIEKDTRVKVVRIEGVKLYVVPKMDVVISGK